MRDKSLGIVVALGMIVLVVMYAVTDGFSSPDQNLVASSDVTVRTTDPTVNDDIDLNILKGFVWINTTTGQAYINVDNTDGAAQWEAFGADGKTATFVVCASNAQDSVNCDYTADGTEDEATINTALAACPAAGCLVYLSDGLFNIAESVGSAIVIQVDDNQHIVGSGIDSTTLRFTDGRGLGTDRYMFSTAVGVQYGVENFSIRNFTIEAQDATDHGIRVKGAQRGLLADLAIVHLDSTESNDEGIQFSGADGDSVRYVDVENVYIDGFGSPNIEFANDVHDLTVNDLVTVNSDAKGVNFRNGDCTGALFDGVNCVDSSNTVDPRRITFNGLISVDNFDDGVHIERGIDLVFNEPFISSNQDHGIGGNTGYGHRITINGGLISENDLTAIWADGSEWFINGTRSVNNAQDTGALNNNRNAYRISASDSRLLNVIADDDQAVGTHRYSLLVNTGASNVVVTGGSFPAGTVGDIDDQGTDTVIWDHEYRIVQDEGSALTGRGTINFTGAGVTCVDNSGSSRTDCTITSGGGSGTLTTVEDDDVQVGGADIVTLDFGTGLDVTESPDTETNISVTLGTTIDSSEITDNEISEADLKAVDAAADEECLTYESTGGDFEWQACGAGGDGVGYDEVLDEGSGLTKRAQVNFIGTGVSCVDNAGATRTDCTISSGGGSGTLTTVKDSGVQVGDADIVSLDFTTGLTCTESPDTEVNCSVDLGTDIDLTGEVTGTLPVANGGTGQTAATADGSLIGNGSAFVVRVVPDCDAAGNAVNFDQTTDAWSCATGYLTTVDISDDTNLVAGTNITLTGDTLSVDDAFLSNTGDTGTGAYDFGGATDFEIPNGAAETPNAAGEIAVDTTDDQLKFYGTAERVLHFTKSLGAVIEDPADADRFVLYRSQEAITVTDIHCLVDPAGTGESVVIDVYESGATADDTTSVDTTITCDNDGAEDDGTLTNPTIDAGDWITLDIGAVTGTVSVLAVTVYYVYTAS